MARYEHLPIFKRMMELTIFIENSVRYFSRYHKYTLGCELRTMCHDGLALICKIGVRPLLFGDLPSEQ